jgi:hypothetical protein
MRSGEGSSERRSRKKGPSRAMDGYRIAYKPLADSTPEAEVKVLAAVHRFVLDRHDRPDGIATDDAKNRDEHAK